MLIRNGVMELWKDGVVECWNNCKGGQPVRVEQSKKFTLSIENTRKIEHG